MRKVGGCLAMAFGAFMGLGVLLNVGGRHGVAALAFAFVVFTLVPFALGVLLVQGASSAPRDLDARRAWDSELLRLAAQRSGSLTVSEVVAHAELDAETAERYLDDFCKRGLAEHRITDDGHVVYRFEQAPTPEAKAKRVLGTPTEAETVRAAIDHIAEMERFWKFMERSSGKLPTGSIERP